MGSKGGEVVKALGAAFKSSALTQYAGLSLFLVLSLFLQEVFRRVLRFSMAVFYHVNG